MPLISGRLIESVFTPEQQMARDLTGSMVAIEALTWRKILCARPLPTSLSSEQA
jgi:hypothetical protein